MVVQEFHLAQVNIARMRAPLDDPQMADFMNNLAVINALAEQTPGFVWRLKDEIGDATSIRVFEDKRILVNMSVWESIDALFQYAYYSQHADFFRRRMEWFRENGYAVAGDLVDSRGPPTHIARSQRAAGNYRRQRADIPRFHFQAAFQR
jgi:hypothetical protein